MSATFTCRVNSHPFQERRVGLLEPSKIGRSVARARPAAGNAIFDCKVLSRNHALLWYEEGKFYLKDTKSSNGTFVNNQRLSKGSEESLPFEVNSGDIVQFGVDVVENSRRVTHGCIVSQVRLYLPNGDEAKQSDMSLTSHILDKVSHSLGYPTIQSQDLYQLHQYLQEAMHREQMLEQKLALLQRLVVDSHEISEKGWQALIDEDKLLSRVEFLENQLQTYSKTLSEESAQKELLQLQEEKQNYEATSKETLRQVLGEKLEAQQKLGNLERSYSNAEDECTHLRDVLTMTQKDLKDLVEKHQTLTEKAQETERTLREEKKALEQEKEERTTHIQRLEETGKDAQQRMEDAVAEVEKCQTEIEELKGQIEEMKETSTGNNKDFSTPQVINGSLNLKDKLNDILSHQDDISLADIKVSLKEDNIELVKTIELCETPSEEKMNIVNIPHDNIQVSTVNRSKIETDGQTQDKLLIARLEARIAQLEEAVSEGLVSLKQEAILRLDLETELDQIHHERENEKEMLAETTRNLQAALSDREAIFDKEEKLKSRIEESEKLLKACDTDSISSSSETDDLGQGDDDDDIACGSLVIARAKLKELKTRLREKETQLAVAQANSEKSEVVVSTTVQKSEELETVKSLLNNSEERIKVLEAELLSLRGASSETDDLRVELEEAQRIVKEQSALCEEAQRRAQQADESENVFRKMHEQLEKEKSERVKELEDSLASLNKQQESYNLLLEEKSKLDESMKEYVNEVNTLKQFQKDSVELTKENEKLAEERQSLLDDVKSLKEKMERQKKEGFHVSSSAKEQELKEKLQAKQEEIDSVNQKFSDLLDEQQKLTTKASQPSENNGGFGSALIAAVFAVLIGIGFLIWKRG